MSEPRVECERCDGVTVVTCGPTQRGIVVLVNDQEYGIGAMLIDALRCEEERLQKRLRTPIAAEGDVADYQRVAELRALLQAACARGVLRY